MTKFKIGDQVRIIGYGQPFWWNSNSGMPRPNFPVIEENEDLTVFDLRPEIIGQVGIVSKAETCQGRGTYALEGTTIYAWYDDDQLELIFRPEYL
jgi:hypothetical protein